MQNRWFFTVLGFSTLLNVVAGYVFVFSILSRPVFSGNYDTEDINLFARIQRADFLGEVLRKQFETDGGKNLPTIISQLAQNPNPQLWMSGEHGLLKMNAQAFIVLTREETEAVIAHELAHIFLEHPPRGPNEESDMEEEKEADKFAVRYVARQALIRAIEKLSRNEHERATRVEAIGE